MSKTQKLLIVGGILVACIAGYVEYLTQNDILEQSKLIALSDRIQKMTGGILVACIVVWFLGSRNPITPAGYVGYLTQDAILGQSKFIGIQTGPSSPGRTWLANVTNVSITPYTFTEAFAGDTSVLAKDNLLIQFQIHVIWNVKSEDVKNFIEKYATLNDGNNSEEVITVAYNNLVKEPLRTYARDELQKFNSLDIKDKISEISAALSDRIQKMTEGTPFNIRNVVVSNIQYPQIVSDSVAEKLATTQILERKQMEIAVEEKEKQKRIVQAEGIARAMEIIQLKLTPQYLQHEAIEAQKLMVNSPNHSVIYIPVGYNGVPLVGTFNTSTGK